MDREVYEKKDGFASERWRGSQLEESFIPLTHPYVALFRETADGDDKDREVQAFATRSIFIGQNNRSIILENSDVNAAIIV